MRHDVKLGRQRAKLLTILGEDLFYQAVKAVHDLLAVIAELRDDLDVTKVLAQQRTKIECEQASLCSHASEVFEHVHRFDDFVYGARDESKVGSAELSFSCGLPLRFLDLLL